MSTAPAGVPSTALCPAGVTPVTDRADEQVVLNHHVPNCCCRVLDHGRVELSATCAGWTKVIQRYIDDRTAAALAAAADALPTFEFMLLDPDVAAVAPAQIGAWLRRALPGGVTPMPDRADETASWEFGVFRDDTGEQVGVGTTSRLDAAREDADAWRRDGFPATLRRRPVAPWQDFERDDHQHRTLPGSERAS